MPGRNVETQDFTRKPGRVGGYVSGISSLEKQGFLFQGQVAVASPLCPSWPSWVIPHCKYGTHVVELEHEVDNHLK